MFASSARCNFLVPYSNKYTVLVPCRKYLVCEECLSLLLNCKSYYTVPGNNLINLKALIYISYLSANRNRLINMSFLLQTKLPSKGCGIDYTIIGLSVVSYTSIENSFGFWIEQTF